MVEQTGGGQEKGAYAKTYYFRSILIVCDQPIMEFFIGGHGMREMAAGYGNDYYVCMPDLVDAHYNLGTVLHEQEKFDEAEAEFAEARRLKPGIDEEP